MAESEELKSLLMKVKEKCEKVGLKLTIMASGPITSWPIDGKKRKQWQTIFMGSSHCGCWLQPWNERILASLKDSIDQLSILKSRDITLPTNVHIVKALVFPVVMYGYENWAIKKAEHRRIDAFELWCWRRLLRVPWTTKRSNQSILKEHCLAPH